MSAIMEQIVNGEGSLTQQDQYYLAQYFQYQPEGVSSEEWEQVLGIVGMDLGRGVDSLYHAYNAYPKQKIALAVYVARTIASFCAKYRQREANGSGTCNIADIAGQQARIMVFPNGDIFGHRSAYQSFRSLVQAQIRHMYYLSIVCVFFEVHDAHVVMNYIRA